MTAFSSNLNLPIREDARALLPLVLPTELLNSWKCWVGKKGDVYIICRDNLKDAKVSLHASGRWRMALEERVRTKYPAERAGVKHPPESYGYFLGVSLEGGVFLSQHEPIANLSILIVTCR
jgi:hypothetical protein